MLNRNSRTSFYPAAVVVALAVSVLIAFGTLIEAVAGTQSFI